MAEVRDCGVGVSKAEFSFGATLTDWAVCHNTLNPNPSAC